MADGVSDGGAAVQPKIDYSRAFNQLCHLVALNRTDSVEGAIDNLVLTTVVVAQPHDIRGPIDLTSAIFVLFGAQLEEDRVRASLDGHLGVGTLMRDRAGTIVPAPEAAARVEQRIAEARHLEEAVKAEWLASVRVPGLEHVDGEALWRCLQLYMALAFRRHGAETVVLLSPGAAARKMPSGALSNYMNASIDRTGLRDSASATANAINAFFSSPTPQRSRYVSQLLDGTFTFFALSLDEETSEYLKSSIEPLNVLLDTNFIFGLLDLHNNYLVKASKELVRFIQESRIPFKLFYHEYTLREIERTLLGLSEQLRARRWQQALSRAAIASDAVYGLERVYHLLNSEQPVDVDAFLAKYENPAILLKALGLEIYRGSGTAPYSTEEKGFVVADYKAFLDRFAPRERSYQAVDHDASVWLALSRLRKPGVPTLRSGFIFLTNDYWFHLWDKRNKLQMATPGGVVLPTQLLQVLRPLVPATDDFDRRFGETFALPEFRTAQSGYGRVSSKVLSYLATFKDVPEELALSLLKDHALAARLREVSADSTEFADAIESRLVELNRGLIEEKTGLQEELIAAREAAEREAAERQSTVSGTREDEARLGAELEELRGELKRHETRADSAEEELRQRRSLERGAGFVLMAVAAAVLLWFGPELWSLPWSADHPRRVNLTLAAAISTTGVAWIIAQERLRLWALGVAVLGGLFAVVQVL